MTTISVVKVTFPFMNRFIFLDLLGQRSVLICELPRTLTKHVGMVLDTNFRGLFVS